MALVNCLATVKGSCEYNDQKSIPDQTHNESNVFLVILTHLTSRDLREALVENSQHVPFVVRMDSCYTALAPWFTINTTVFYEWKFFFVYVQNSQTLKECFNYGEEKLSVFSYYRSSACKYQISIFLDCAILKC